jgi:putative multiple sugar transport system substrate-binding protein
MKSRKLFLAVVAVLICVLTLVACTAPAAAPSPSKAAEPAPASSAAAPPSESKAAESPSAAAPAGGSLIGVAMPTKSLQRWNQDGDNMKKQLEAKGYQVDLQYAEDKPDTQLSQVENMVTKGCKVLVVASIDGKVLAPALQKAADAGIKIIAYDRLLLDTANCDYYATFDNFKVGALQGSYAEKALGLKDGKGPFNMEIFGGSPDDNNARFVNAGQLSFLQQYLDSKKLVIPSGQFDFNKIAIPGWKSEGAQARMDNLLTANYAGGKKLDAVICPNDSLALGVIAALDAVGYGTADKPYPVITGQDCDKANVKAIKAGKQTMSVYKDTRQLAQKVVEMVDAIMQGKEPPVNDTQSYNNNVKIVPSFLIEPILCTKDNYEELLIKSGYYTEADIS